MTDPETYIDEKISQFKKKKEKIRTDKALFFMKESQKIFEDDFTPGTALLVLTEAWKAATQSQKEQWKKRGPTFREFTFPKNRKATQMPEPTHHES